ncbi:MAG TPA: hypothetical protein VEY33_10340 [Gemmatimonadota bacterium]|nr:hypothetical protein [Gemmatimonadota bacterium]
MSRTCLRLGIVCAAITLAAIMGCGTSDEDVERNGEVSDTVSSATDLGTDGPSEARDPSRDEMTRVLRGELVALAGTDVIGSVSLSPGDGGTAVSVEIHGANSGLPYVAELVGGSCESPAAVIAVLGEITAGEEGDGAFRHVLDPSLLGSDQANRAVRVRGAGDKAAIVACGNLGNPER